MVFSFFPDIVKANREYIIHLKDLQPGWKILNRLKDVSDTEWISYKYYFHRSWSYLLIQFVVTELIRRYKSSLIKPWYIISSVIYVTFYMSLKQLVFIFLQPVLYSTIIFCGGKKATVWITSILLLGSYNTLKFKYFFWYILDSEDLQEEEVYLLMGCIAWIELRCISFCIDYIDNKDSHNISKSQCLLNMLSYVIYLPVLYSGPVILYKDFEKSFTSPPQPLWDRIKIFVFNISLFLFYFFAMELALHFIHFHALQERIEVSILTISNIFIYTFISNSYCPPHRIIW